jgi:eukaryotic-like serine/threonine-protein kinase
MTNHDISGKFGKKLSIKKIAIFSCSGIVLLVLFIPTIIVLRAADLRSKVVWRSPIKNMVLSVPVISDGILYFGTVRDIDPPAFYALDSASGKQLWITPLDGVVMNSPVLTDDSVCFDVSGGSFYCLSRKDGGLQWEFSPEQRDLDPATCASCALMFNSPVIEDDVIYLSSYDNNVYALDAQTGHLNWAFSTGGAIMDAPAIVDGIVYVASYDGYAYLLDSKTGQEVRRYFVSDPSPMDYGYYSGALSTPLVDAATIYVAYGPLRAIDIQSGDIKWTAFDSTKYKDQITGSPFFFEDSIIVATNDAIYAIDKSSGETRWKYSDIKGSVYFTPTLHNEVIYVGGSSGYLYGIQAKTGKQVFRYNLRNLDFRSYPNLFGNMVFSPAVDDQYIYVKWFKNLYAIKK